MSKEVTTLVNGEPGGAIDAHDRGFQYGDGIFETIAVWHETPLLWDRHLARLARGAERLGIAPPAATLWQADAERLCAGVERAVLKIFLTRGVGGRGYAPPSAIPPTRAAMMAPWPDHPLEHARDGVAVRICQTRLGRNPRLAGIKHLNRLEQVLGRGECGTGDAEGLMLDEDGNVIEGTQSNMFIVSGGRLRTPDLASCGVEGVMRGVVLDAASRLGVATAVEPLTIDDVHGAQELFLTNSLIGIWPVRQVNGKGYAPGPITRTIQHAIHDAHCFDRN